MLTKAQIVQWLERTNAVLQENKDYLTQLDSAIGDADHGANMSRGFTKVMDKLPTETNKDIGSILKVVGMTLISSVGGASGPLYGTFYTRAGMASAAKETLTDQDLLALLESGVEGVVQRGRAQPDDKTMCDAWWPALEAMRRALAEGQDTLGTLRAAVNGAQAGMEATIPLQARKGRASYLGERSIGHQDPGATSSYLILKALLETLEN
jgi:dihydroxyacetone kinase-like protein